MCRCWLRCWEDFYWNCIEEKFCYDETIANYNPEEDEYFQKKSGNSFLSAGKLENNNSSPVCIQPSMGNANPRTPNISAGKIHEEDYRQIQINAPILAPEIMSVFSNSQIFHEHHPVIAKKGNAFPGVHGKGGREADSEKLLFRLEGHEVGPDAAAATTTTVASSSRSATAQQQPLPQINVTDHSLTQSNQFPSIREEDDDDPNAGADGVVLRPHVKSTDSVGDDADDNAKPIARLRHVQSVPYFAYRPASENDIFSITGSMGQISMTPEIPAISYSTLPKNYEDTPTIEKYKESVSLYSIQTAQSARMSQLDLSMPRYFRRSGTALAAANAQSTGDLSSSNGDSGGAVERAGRGGAMVFMHPGGGDAAATASSSSSGTAAKVVEKSKRLKLLRTKLPPLSIHLGGRSERHKDKGIE